MKDNWIISVKLVSILAILSLFCLMNVSAEQIPDLEGKWNQISSEMYSISAGYENISSSSEQIIVTNQNNRTFAGEETYVDPDDRMLTNNTISGVLAADGEHFWMDHDGTGLSYGEMVSDHEFYNYILLPDIGPMIYVTHMIKEGTLPSTEINEVPNLLGTWDYVNEYRDLGINITGKFTVDNQKGRLFCGIAKHITRDGTPLELNVVGAVDDNGNMYAVTDGHIGIWTGNLIGNDIAHLAITIPNDPDQNSIVDRWMYRTGTTFEKPKVTYPDISGNYSYQDRIIVQNGSITDMGALKDNWVYITNQNGQFFSKIIHFNQSHVPPVLELPGMFLAPDKAVILSSGRAYLIYDIINGDTIESIDIRNETDSTIYLNSNTRETTK